MKSVLFLILFSSFFASASFARAPYKKALGLADCTACHIKGDFTKPNLENPTYKKAKEMVEKTAKGEGEFKGKKCFDCHQGQQKPAKKG